MFFVSFSKFPSVSLTIYIYITCRFLSGCASFLRDAVHVTSALPSIACDTAFDTLVSISIVLIVAHLMQSKGNEVLWIWILRGVLALSLLQGCTVVAGFND